MRLLRLDANGDVSLTEHPSDALPPYAILSHTWGEQEVLFEDIVNGRGKGMVGYQKINFCIEQAKKDRLGYFWVDTCCINKANASEYGEALNSMFRWYRGAERCYVYLTDVSSGKRSHEGFRAWDASFRASRWFTRGWTLQELLAPVSVEFFSREGQLLGSKNSLASLINEITAIPEDALRGVPPSDFTVQERIDWAAARTTTRLEDRAYCLFGIFEVFMPPIYGEGEHALVRLKDAIDRKYGIRSNMETLFKKRDAFTLRHADSGYCGSVPDESQPQISVDELRNFLGFEQMDSRRSTIKSAYASTCEWLLKTREYMDWLDLEKFEQHRGFLWIKGKPGAGKSTILKFAHSQASKQPSNREILVSYFFNARGDSLEKSTLGMYRSLLFQLLGRAEDLQQAFEDIPASTLRAPQSTWTIEGLREIFTAAVRMLGPRRRLKCFIDALDECDEQEIHDMVLHFEDLGEISSGIRICFASRHYPAIDIRNGVELVLEDQSGHSEDLSRYVRSHLRIGQGKNLNDEIKAKVQEKANGVFMWAVLVIEILNKEFLRGKIFAVKKRLNEIPAKLSDLFREILSRDSANMDDLLLCIQWILFAKRPLLRKEFYYAMVAGLDPDAATTEWDPESVSEDDMTRFVLNCSKGLAELTKPRSLPKVQFIHESVRDFLIKEGGLYEMWPDLRASSHSSSHHRLSKCCQKYLAVDLTKYVPPEGLPKAKSEKAEDIRRALDDQLPLLKYAAEHVSYHANEAAKGSVQDDFLIQIDLRNWVIASNLTVKHETRRRTEDVPLVYLLAERDCAQLIKSAYPLDTAIPPITSEKYRHPLLAAIGNKHWDVVRAILELCDESRTDGIIRSLEAQQDISVGKDVSPLHWALRKGNLDLAEVLAGSRQTDVNLIDTYGHTPSSLAAKLGYVTVVQRLLSRDATHSSAQEPLEHAASAGHLEVVELLLESGAGTESDARSSSLYAASRAGHQEVVKSLLRHGARPDALGPTGTALRIASENGHQEVVKLLLDAGALVDARIAKYNTALQAAVEEGHESVVKLLLDANALDLPHSESGGALETASEVGDQKILKLLLGARAQTYIQGWRYDGALEAASVYGHLDAVRLLIDVSVNVGAPKWCYDGAVYAASKCGHFQIVKLLLEVCAPVDGPCGYFGAALQAASRNHHQDVARLLLAARAEITSQKKGAVTALSISSKEGLEEVDNLLDAGAEIRQEADHGETRQDGAAGGSMEGE